MRSLASWSLLVLLLFRDYTMRVYLRQTSLRSWVPGLIFNTSHTKWWHTIGYTETLLHSTCRQCPFPAAHSTYASLPMDTVFNTVFKEPCMCVYVFPYVFLTFEISAFSHEGGRTGVPSLSTDRQTDAQRHIVIRSL
jgi:hypothetical protein